MAEAVYRNLLRATRVAFMGDQRTLLAARQQIRQGFREKASLSASDPAAVEAIKVAKDIALILRHNVVQGQSDGNDVYRKSTTINHIERGDNDSVKNPKGKSGSGGGCGSSACCSS
ncbi:hypothetical protein TD95_002553 [Thielaviopsis punctulata]|uniref:Mitochondrial zinc maintenance protein 1, mitochondrial n=1 Tax=Thielaviopsis punctulata TaxID=72032 RepID=A0A0F4ZKA3_9PEZI|nr:hypothetical protein TD95_002553 [Thielaviopsis punctulata]